MHHPLTLSAITTIAILTATTAAAHNPVDENSYAYCRTLSHKWQEQACLHRLSIIEAAHRLYYENLARKLLYCLDDPQPNVTFQDACDGEISLSKETPHH